MGVARTQYYAPWNVIATLVMISQRFQLQHRGKETNPVQLLLHDEKYVRIRMNGKEYQMAGEVVSNRILTTLLRLQGHDKKDIAAIKQGATQGPVFIQPSYLFVTDGDERSGSTVLCAMRSCMVIWAPLMAAKQKSFDVEFPSGQILQTLLRVDSSDDIADTPWLPPWYQSDIIVNEQRQDWPTGGRFMLLAPEWERDPNGMLRFKLPRGHMQVRGGKSSFPCENVTIAAIKWHGRAFDHIGCMNVVKEVDIDDGTIVIEDDVWPYRPGRH